MNKTEKTYVILTVAVVGVTAVRYLKHRKESREAIAKIDAEAELQINAIKTAGQRVQENLKAGKHYNSIGEIMDEFDFEIIAARFDK